MPLIKKIDILLVRGFIPPFIVTFLIAIFVLVMQMLWNYIDDIIGKGAGLLFILEMVFYLSISLIPMALPIAVLISSVMVMGNLAERFELTSMKSAGIPLLRIMRSLMALTILISGFSYFTGNNLIPLSTLKFRKRLTEVKNQKPTLSLEQGIFNEDFSELVIHIGEKEGDNRTIRDVIIYDQRKNNRGQISQVLAQEGEMSTSEDDRYFFLHLKDGVQYEEMVQNNKVVSRDNTGRPLPFVRTRFGAWERVFDLSEFDLREMDEDRFQSHHAMMTSGQLRAAIDTLGMELDKKQEQLRSTTRRFFHPLGRLDKDSTFEETFAQDMPVLDQPVDTSVSDTAFAVVSDTATRFIALFPTNKREQLYTRAKSATRSLLGTAQATLSQTTNIFERRVKSIFELHMKFTMPLVCFIFLFIGAPLGAIVRKGGFGYPILIAIVFFTMFVIMNVGFKNMAEERVLSPELGAWLPILVLFPIGAFLTVKAMNDSKILDIGLFFTFVKKKGEQLRRFFKGERAGTSPEQML